MKCNRCDLIKTSGAIVAGAVFGARERTASPSEVSDDPLRSASQEFARRVSAIYEPSGEWSRWLVDGKRVMTSEAREQNPGYCIKSNSGACLAVVDRREDIRPRVIELLEEGRVQVSHQPSLVWD
jgi:hypothetical protein